MRKKRYHLTVCDGIGCSFRDHGKHVTSAAPATQRGNKKGGRVGILFHSFVRYAYHHAPSPRSDLKGIGQKIAHHLSHTKKDGISYDGIGKSLELEKKARKVENSAQSHLTKPHWVDPNRVH